MKTAKDNVKRDNRRALPRFLLMLLAAGAFGGVMGFLGAQAGAAGLTEELAAGLTGLLRAAAPWGIPVTSGVLLGSGWWCYARARRRWAAWDGEDEDTAQQADQDLNWALLTSAMAMVVDLFFLTVGALYGPALPVVAEVLASFALLVLLQQKVVDLTRRMNPEKRGSVYEMKFQKTWLDSCDESERAQIGRAAYQAYRAGVVTCLWVWVALIILSIPFDLGLAPMAAVLAVLAVLGVMQAAYIFACIRENRPGRAE